MLANTLQFLKKKSSTELIWRKCAQNFWPSHEEKKFGVMILNSKLNGKRKEASTLGENSVGINKETWRRLKGKPSRKN